MNSPKILVDLPVLTPRYKDWKRELQSLQAGFRLMKWHKFEESDHAPIQSILNKNLEAAVDGRNRGVIPEQGLRLLVDARRLAEKYQII